MRRLSIMAGGARTAFDRAKPIFECMGHADRIVHIGDEPGSGQICKVCNQIAIGGALAGVSEALALARKAGVDGARVRQALLGGFASSRVLEVHGERILTNQFTPGFRTTPLSEGPANRAGDGGGGRCFNADGGTGCDPR